MRRGLALIGLLIAMVGLSAQFGASMPLFIAAGKSPDYAYPFLDLGTNDATSVTLSVGIIIGLFAVLGAFVVWADRLLPRLLPVQD